MPAYNASKTLEQTFREIPRESVHECIVVDDSSADSTVEVARRLGLRVFLHRENQGYGGSQKTCYIEALKTVLGNPSFSALELHIEAWHKALMSVPRPQAKK